MRLSHMLIPYMRVPEANVCKQNLANNTPSNALTHGAEPYLRWRHSISYLRISQYFIEPESSLPCSQEPSTGPYPKPDQSSPYYPILFL
jgi:hypothetical protein